MSTVKEYMAKTGADAKTAAVLLAASTTAQRNQALLAMADAICSSATTLQTENRKDLDAGKANGLDSAMLDRLELNDARIEGMAEGLRQVATLPDPVGEITGVSSMPSGIKVGKMRIPLGVIGIIYESRPNVTADAAGLCLKSGNASILRGGSEAIHSNMAIMQCIKTGLRTAGLPETAVQVLNTTDRAAVGEMLTMEDQIDVIIPRGGKGLIERVSKESKVPVIKHLDGICHVFIDDQADQAKAHAIAMNSKTHRYGVCNAMETLLVHTGVAQEILPALQTAMDKKAVELRGCEKTCDILTGIVTATEEDWSTEYLAPTLSILVVDDLDAAITHINQYGSQHTDAIVTENHTNAMKFLTEVDSSSVIINASTRFADGFEYGLGAEIGISTNKLHARGPVGLEGLTTQKFVVFGDGHIRQ